MSDQVRDAYDVVVIGNVTDLGAQVGAAGRGGGPRLAVAARAG